MSQQIVVKRGQAFVTQNGLRCRGPRAKDPNTPCGKLVVKKNALGQIAGAFKCERCSQEIEIELKS